MLDNMSSDPRQQRSGGGGGKVADGVHHEVSVRLNERELLLSERCLRAVDASGAEQQQ